jgi:hypothetical protein
MHSLLSHLLAVVADAGFEQIRITAAFRAAGVGVVSVNASFLPVCSLSVSPFILVVGDALDGRWQGSVKFLLLNQVKTLLLPCPI